MHLMSRAFHEGDEIPVRFTCDGSNLSPPLEWHDVPPGTRSLALIIEDPDAPDPDRPRTTYTHWVLYDIPPETRHLDESMANVDLLPPGTKLGVNGSQRPNYGGPCPPTGRHRYFHRLFALDTVLPDLDLPTREALLRQMKGHVLAEADLVATYARH